jgi:hypothetical protein
MVHGEPPQNHGSGGAATRSPPSDIILALAAPPQDALGQGREAPRKAKGSHARKAEVIVQQTDFEGWKKAKGVHSTKRDLILRLFGPSFTGGEGYRGVSKMIDDALATELVREDTVVHPFNGHV